MRTIRIKVYKFDELSEQAKQTAIENWRNTTNDNGGNQFYFDEVIESVKAVLEIFNLKTGNQYNDIRTGHIDDCILDLAGLRLHKYIWNNYKNSLYKGKYYSTPGYYDENKQYHYKYRHSKITLENSCVLTGVCYDNDILQPVYDFLDNPALDTSFADLISDIEGAITKTFDDTEEWVNSDEFIKGEIEANEYEFTKDGNLFS